MSTIIQLLDRPIAYNPAFAKLKVGKVKAGPVAAVFLSQMVYWHNRMDGGWMYKTQANITSETALTRDEQETARKRLIALGVLEEDLRGVPATMHYRINTERLEALLVETTKPAKKVSQDKTRMRSIQNVETPQSGLVQSRKQECGNTANKNVEAPQTRMVEPHEQASGNPTNFHTGDYTENTQEITQDIKPSCPVAAQPDEQSDPAAQVLEHFNRVTNSSYGRGGRTKTTLGYIRGRLADNYSAEDLMLVVDYLTAKWADDSKMSDYLRPSTLFGPENCVEYFEKASKWHASGRPKCVKGRWVKDDAAFKSTHSQVDYSLPDNAGFRS
ncbi:conserved phage C-terminal domain-containing protein [Phytobacter sp. SCO41]|uniref:conserved phage C-terminal domain-containing protein n=1 Tax=Phytobacter sp. SCO41 TaxID=1756993 RepID=UPI001CC5B27B|nr:conserved phage C-terminal domain-containing protein [Phytobacter sp. SCO41]